MKARIGIPCGLFYHKHSVLWKAFFNRLQLETVESGGTSKKILELGLRCCTAEACLPVKVYFGHVASLSNETDFLFVPRYISLHAREYICPKFGGLPDMLRCNIKGIPPLIDAEVNLYSKRACILTTVNHIAEALKIDCRKAQAAYYEALAEYTCFRCAQMNSLKSCNGKLRIMLLGHPYLVYDPFINLNIIEKLKHYGVSIITLEMINPSNLRAQALRLSKPMFWTFGTQALGCTYDAIEHKRIHGMIYLSSFGCGIDAFVSYLAEKRLRSLSAIPFMNIVLDEHTADAGLDTRIEAFIDTILWRSQDDRHFSTHGQCLY